MHTEKIKGIKSKRNFSFCHGRLRRQGKNGKEIATASAKPRNDIIECSSAASARSARGREIAAASAKPRNDIKECPSAASARITIIGVTGSRNAAKNGVTTEKTNRKFGVIKIIMLDLYVARARPFADVDSEYYSFWKAAGSLAVSDYSFPSGHTTAAMAFGASLFLVFDKRYSWAFLLIPVLMGFTRIYFGVHYTTDVLGGMIVGGVAAIAAYFIVRLLCKNPKVYVP